LPQPRSTVRPQVTPAVGRQADLRAWLP